MKKNTHNKLTCLFGFHDYSQRLTEDKRYTEDGDRCRVHLCKICKRSGYKKYPDGEETWTDYDEEGNCTHERRSDRHEVWADYDEKGNAIHIKWDSGYEVWKNNYEHWTEEKPKNWKYEKHI